MLPSTQSLILKERGNDLTKSMLFLMNLKNNNAKKDLHLAYSQENISIYPLSIEAMVDICQHNITARNQFIRTKVKRGIEIY